MAAARDQAARILRSEPDSAENDTAREAPAAIADSIRAQLSDDTPSRRSAELPERPAVAKPAAPTAATAPAARCAEPFRTMMLVPVSGWSGAIWYRDG